MNTRQFLNYGLARPARIIGAKLPNSTKNSNSWPLTHYFLFVCIANRQPIMPNTGKKNKRQLEPQPNPSEDEVSKRKDGMENWMKTFGWEMKPKRDAPTAKNTGKEEAKDGSTPKRARAGKKKADGAVGKNNAVAGRTAIAVGMRVKFYVEDPRCSLYGSGEVTGVYGYGDGFVSVRCIVTLKKYFVKAGQCVVVSTTAAPIIPDAARDGVRVNFENQLVLGWVVLVPERSSLTVEPRHVQSCQ